jgi:uncharacterized protein (TIGR02001 family)
MKALKFALVAALAMPTFNLLAEEDSTSEHSVSYNVGLFSEYIFRGYTQTHNDPALQGGVDYEHSSGLYLGLWSSNISWINDAGASNSGHSLEVDVYGGYAGEFGDTGITYDLGFLQYFYPGDMKSTSPAANTLELYAGLGYKDLSFTYYEVVSKDAWTAGKNNGSGDDADGSFYASLDFEHDIGQYLNVSGLTGTVHVGHQNFAGAANNDISYTDWLIGIDKEWKGVNVGLNFITTNIDNNTAFFVVDESNKPGEDRFVGYVSKTF